MSVLHLWALGIGAFALAAPVAIHLLTRPRPVRMPLSTLRFVREAIHQRRARHRLRDLVVLGLRTLAVALLALALARPRAGQQPLISDRQSGDAVRVVLLDVSQSMAATVGAVQEIAQAKTLAANRYLRYRPGLWANLILAGATPRAVFEEPSTNFEVLRDELSRCQALPERLDVKVALDRAARMLAPASEQDQRRRELVVLSDFQRTTWAAADFSVLPKDTQIQLECTAPAEPLANLAVLRATARPVGGRAGSVQVEIEVGNFTPNSRKIAVDFNLGEAQRRLEGVCAAQVGSSPGRLTLSENLELHGGGWQWGEARLAGVDDALAADNVRPLAVELRPRPTYALLTREAAGRPSSSYFLECALVPDGQRKQSASATVARIDPAGLDVKSLAPADLICLDHPGKLTDEAIQAIVSLLRRGRPILYITAEAIDATNLVRLAEAAGPGLRMPVQFAPPPLGSRRNLVLKSVRSEEPPFAVFGDQLAAITERLRFAGGLSSRPTGDGLADDILASYNDGSACLVCTSSDAGTLAVLNADLAAMDLYRSKAFVPIVEELVERLLGGRGGSRAAYCGQPLVAPLPVEVPSPAGLKIVGPAAPEGEASGGRLGELVDEGARLAWHWRSPDRPGVYRVCRDGQPLLAQAIEIPAEESQLEPMPPEVLKERLAAGYSVFYRSAAADDQGRDDLWKWFAVACVVCLLGEVTSLIAFRT